MALTTAALSLATIAPSTGAATSLIQAPKGTVLRGYLNTLDHNIQWNSSACRGSVYFPQDVLGTDPAQTLQVHLVCGKDGRIQTLAAGFDMNTPTNLQFADAFLNSTSTHLISVKASKFVAASIGSGAVTSRKKFSKWTVTVQRLDFGSTKAIGVTFDVSA